MDNSTGTVNMENHKRSEWSENEIKEALTGASIFNWAPTTSMVNRAVNVKRAEGIYVYDHNDKKYVDWCAGAMCANLGHTMPESVKTAI
jgi:adenosylmethionine-8-amino-7-oxononanoate aminotransferase